MAGVVLLLPAVLGGCTSGAAPPSSSDAGPSGPPTGTPSAVHWRPTPGTTWQWQLSGALDTSVDAAVYDVDGFTTSAAQVAALHRQGRRVVCYIDVGTDEDFRPDRGSFPAALLGRSDGWQGERWLDIRRTGLLEPIIAKRFDMCRAKGFDAVEPDNVDGYSNDTGFPLTAADQLVFNRMVASLAHARGLAVALKNDVDQVPQLVGDFDFSVDEQCAEYQECDALEPFVAQGKAVFEAEYDLPRTAFCGQARQLHFSAMLKHLSLDAWREPC